MNHLLKNCTICPHECRVDRNVGEKGICESGDKMIVASYGPHYGEEPELTGYSFSGTIFFSGCNMMCEFCQNYDISHMQQGRETEVPDMAKIMLALESSGAENINFVTPTHFAPLVAESVRYAKVRGLAIPIVYNCGGYEKIETLRSLDGLVDIYMPDIKFYTSGKSGLYTAAEDYFEYAGPALIEMHRQTGDLSIEKGVAKKGLLVRHLVLPNNQSDTKEIIDFIAEEIGTNTYLNLMDQYHPCYRAHRYDLISRGLSRAEFPEFVEYARSKGFRRPDYLYR